MSPSRIYDISIAVRSGGVVYPGNPEIRIEPQQAIARGAGANVSSLELGSHTGTHVDAAKHFFDDGETVDRIPLDRLIGPAILLAFPDTLTSIGAADLERHDIGTHTRVLLRTRNSSLLEKPEFVKDYTYLAPDGAEYLVQRGVELVGIDYLSIEQFHSGHHRTHLTLLEQAVVIVEGLDLRGRPPASTSSFACRFAWPVSTVHQRVRFSSADPMVPRVAFFDIGGVLGTNGWDRHDRKEAVTAFGLDLEEYERLHHEVVPALEEGRMTIDEYLDRTVFVRPRSFTPEDFRKFIYAQSKPFLEAIAVARELASTGRARLCTASNEGDDLTRYRIRLFGLIGIFDTFLASCWLGVRKPKPDFYHRILAITASRAEDSVFIDDREENVAAAKALGFHVIHYQSADQLRRELGAAGLQLNTQTG